MKEVIEVTGRTVEQAIQKAIELLKLENPQDMETKILEEGNRGVFGVGARDAIILAKAKRNPEKALRDFLKGFFEKFDTKYEMDIQLRDDKLFVRLYGDEPRAIIGKRGSTLDALQYIANIYINKYNTISDKYIKVMLDIENYRKIREESLTKLALHKANIVVSTLRDETLDVMNPFERKVVHDALLDHKLVRTFSIGVEPERRVVISLMKKQEAKSS